MQSLNSFIQKHHYQNLNKFPSWKNILGEKKFLVREKIGPLENPFQDKYLRGKIKIENFVKFLKLRF
jgi:hypothetical protein